MGEIFADILHTHGPEAVAFYGSGQLDTETVYVISKLFKGYLGCNNTDSNSRLCMAAAVAGYRTSLGSDGPPCCYDDIELADVILIIGSNMAEAHPVTFDRIRESKKQRPGQRVVVIDPRRTSTADIADLYLPVAPGGDIALLNAVGRMLLLMGAADSRFVDEHTEGFEEYRRSLLDQDLNELCVRAGLEERRLYRLANLVAGAGSLLSFYCMGLSQSTVGMWKNNSLINLHLLTGQIGKPGVGPFSLTDQPNAMGGREAGLLSHQLPGYRTVEDSEHRRQVEAYWTRPPGSINARPGLTAVEMFRALERGQLKAIWIAGTNPAVSLPDLHHVRRGLQRAQLVVVQDAYHPTETTRLADVLLPAAQWGEKEWTSTNSERTISYSPKLFDPPGLALPDWQIVASFAQRLGFQGFNYASASEVWDEFVGLTPGRPCDMAGAPSARLRTVKSLQWPCPTLDHPGSKRRYRDGTAKANKLLRREPAPFVEINPSDAERLGLREGELVQISSRRGTVQLPARLRSGVAAGMVFVPFHWGDLYGEGNAANHLTISAIGRVAKQPELKFCAVNLEKVCVLPRPRRTAGDALPSPAPSRLPSPRYAVSRQSLQNTTCSQPVT
jgi:ferredoxin-nitrate reductase